MPPNRAFLAEIPGDPLSDYLKATLDAAPALDTAHALVLPRLTRPAADVLAAALAAGKPVYLPAEALPKTLTPALARGLSALTKRGLAICPLTELPRWVQSGANCPRLLTLEYLKILVAQGVDRIYLSAWPAATPLAVQTAKQLNIHLSGVNFHGTGQSHRLCVVHEKK